MAILIGFSITAAIVTIFFVISSLHFRIKELEEEQREFLSKYEKDKLKLDIIGNQLGYKKKVGYSYVYELSVFDEVKIKAFIAARDLGFQGDWGSFTIPIKLKKLEALYEYLGIEWEESKTEEGFKKRKTKK